MSTVISLSERKKERAASDAARIPQSQTITETGGCQVVSLESRRVAVQSADTIVRMWLKRGDLFSAVTMRKALAGLLNSEGLEFLNTRTFSVHLVPEEEGWIWVHPKRTVILEACPECGSDMRRWTYLGTQCERGDWDLYSWGCKECGAVFNRWEVSE